MSPAARWRVVALAGVCATLAVAAVAPKSLLALQLSFFLIVFVLIIPVHELGHAVAGAIVGNRIVSIVVGAGPCLAAFRWLGVNVQINLLPLGGFTAGFPRRGHGWARLRQWIFVAGGPAANVLIYLGLRRVFGAGLDDSDAHPFASSAMFVNWSVLVMNLIPFRTSEGTASDGYGLFTIPFWSKQRVEAGNLLLQGSLLHRERRHDAARSAWREGLAKATDPRQVAILKNNIAFASVVLGLEDDLAEADRLSEQALTALPENAAFAGTRAAVLLRLGRAAEALPLLAASESPLQDGRSQAYNKALAASALAALGRRDEALRKLAEARHADPDCDLIPRAEADIAAAPVWIAPAPDGVDPPAVDPAAGVVMQRRWRRDARILAFASMLLVIGRLGVVDPGPFVILVVMSLAPELAGVFALAGYGLSAGLLYAFGLLRPDGFRAELSAGAAAALTLAMGAAACWMVARHRRLGPAPRSRTPTVLGWILGSLALLMVLPSVVDLSWDRSPLAIHASARAVLAQAPSLIGLAVLLASRRRRAVRLIALAPALLALLAVVPGSRFYLNRIVLADIPTEGAPITWGEPTAATVVRSAHLSGRGGDPTVSPGGRAFFIRGPGSAPPSSAGARLTDFSLRVGDFDGHLVEVAGTAGAFIDDDRLLVLRPRADPEGVDRIVEVRPFQGLEPVWTKELGEADLRDAAIRIHRGTGTVFILGNGADDQPIDLRTTLEPETPIEVNPLRQREEDRVLATLLPTAGWGGMLVARTTGRSTDLLWRTPRGERRLASRLPSPRCAEALAGSSILWCFTPQAPILLRIDAKQPRLTRVPGEIPSPWDIEMLAPSVLAILRGDEIRVVDLKAGRGTRLTLPDATNRQDIRLARGALATVARPEHGGEGTLVVYALPSAPGTGAR